MDNIPNDNSMHKVLYEWTIFHHLTQYVLCYDGCVDYGFINAVIYGVRSVFYIKLTIKLISGDGSKKNKEKTKYCILKEKV